MSDIIHLLPDHIANQIAAGEVIQRPASVVKELVENAVDAGAEHITVNIKDGGRSLVQVIDDGKGMSETDARMAFERHATSKIREVQDLFSLYTMGFRGEALASIAAVAQVELRTRLKGAELGTKLTISGSTLDSIESHACAEGAVFSVKNLFYNVPARRKFLKSNETEFRNILTEFERVALVNPEIAFILYHNDTEVLNLPVSGLRQRIITIFGKRLNQRLLSFDISTSIVSMEGFIGRADMVKKKGYLNYFFVNGRYMRHPYFHKAVMQAYEPLIPTGEFPDYFIYLTLDPSAIDVNIHPTKTEIKFENEQPIWQIISSTVREVLGKANAIPSIDFDTEGAIEMPVYNPSRQSTVAPPEVEVNRNYNPFCDTSSPHAVSYNRQDWEKLYRGFEQDADLKPEENSIPGSAQTAIFLSSEKETEDCFQEVANPCFQYKNRYIITPLKSGLVLIDQYRAHVRILYDQYIFNVKQQKTASQQMLFPEIIEFTPAEAALLSSLTEHIQWLGFNLSPMGNCCYSINALPAGVQDCNPATLIKELVNSAADHDGNLEDYMAETLALSLAKAAAIPPGKKLTVEEMEAIVAALFSSDANNLTPDGKVIMFVLTDDELVKRFK
ncbi:MAG: DNA mismatch repair endonuclease MutL [Tannerella sp.]|jgi:DNA mismatch repair protein MutL|nr:DNA mismatch repair endonuclease MutL [Tannerella sp.]